MFSAGHLSVATLICGAVLLVAAVVIELRSGRIPNALSVMGLLAAVGVALVDQLWLTHLSGFLLGLALGIVLYARGGVGAGYVKLQSVVGGLLGPLAPVANTLVALAVVAVWRLIDPQPLPAELQFEAESPPPTVVRGSLIIAAGAIITVVFLWRPWC